MKCKRPAVPYAIGHETESVAKHYEAAVGSDALVDNGVAVAEDEEISMAFFLFEIAGEAHERIAVGKDGGVAWRVGRQPAVA